MGGVLWPLRSPGSGWSGLALPLWVPRPSWVGCCCVGRLFRCFFFFFFTAVLLVFGTPGIKFDEALRLAAKGTKDGNYGKLD